jgi:hypothetical protein
MAEVSLEPPVLSQEEWALFDRLLRFEQDKLLHEINHTDKRQFRDSLRHELDLVQGLLGRIPQREE